MDSEPVVLFENEDIDVLRYQRDYPKIARLKSTAPQSSPDSVYTQSNAYDRIYNDIIGFFRQNGDADVFLHQVLASKEKVGMVLLNPQHRHLPRPKKTSTWAFSYRSW